MFGNIFKGPAPASSAPEGMRLYAVGDIHGCADLLDALMDKIAAEESAALRTQLVFLGDYLDRGPDSRGVIDRLLAVRQKRPDTVFLKGNHEDAFLDFLLDPGANADWIEWGGETTLQSYGVRAADKVISRLNETMPDEHRRFLEALPLTAVFGDYLFVHAGVRPGVPLDQQQERDLLWIRGEFHRAPKEKRPDKIVVHGHEPERKPVDAGWRIGVDTGACFTGRLTAVVLEGTSRRFLST